MIRFFVSPSVISETNARLSAEDMAHIRVLRLRSDERFIVCDGLGTDYICRLDQYNGCAEIISAYPSSGEPNIKCTVFAALSKGDKLDLIVQKTVELGVFNIVLFPSERCIAVLDDKSAQKKITRLNRIACEAAKQSGRGIVPAVSLASSFKNAVQLAAKAGVPLFLYECEEEKSLKQTLTQHTGMSEFAIFTGPEGGFTTQEAEYAAQNGMISVSLGRRILRCETAPICALSAVMYHTENL